MSETATVKLETHCYRKMMYKICRAVISLKIYAQYRSKLNTNSYKNPEKGFQKYTLYKMGSKAKWLKIHCKTKEQECRSLKYNRFDVDPLKGLLP